MKKIETASIIPAKILLVGIYAPYNKTGNIEYYYQEFKNLVKSNNIETEDAIFIKLKSIDPGYFITSGKLEDIQKICKEKDIEEVVISEPLTPNQQKNLSEFLKCKVFDRTQLILEIFEKNAHSAEGKLQVELAMLEYSKSRLSGQGIHMSQQSGGIGTKGPGETAKEKETQHIERRVLKLKRDLKVLANQRETQRKKRLSSNIPLVCLIGYTNSGKSTILNALTHSDVIAENKLFATLDTTTRELYIDHKKVALISDTVGFIQLLPHRLIEAFKSTLKELQFADLLLHVIDLSDLNWQHHIQIVLEVLKELEVDKPILHIFNKIDKVEINDSLEKKMNEYTPNIKVSALEKNGLTPLQDYILDFKFNKSGKHD